ncbi:MAG: glycoside hydrolase family 3 protein [Cyclobacteriaceae bacterium]
MRFVQRALIACFLCFSIVVNGQNDPLDHMVGQMIMVGYNDYYNASQQKEILRLIEEGKVGGIILFEKNLKKNGTKAELAKMIAELQSKAEIPLFMGIDEEGGRVNRLKPKYGFPETRSAQYLGELDNVDSTRYYANAVAENLSKYGFNVNYAPNVDVNINPDNPVIGKAERSYSAEPATIARHAEIVIEEHDKQNVITVLKHFPGHGSSAADSHLGIADVSNSWQFNEIYPYMELIRQNKVKAVMSAHIVNRVLDERMLPGTLSDKVIKGILRDALKFDGVVFSDDMHMGAIAKEYGLEEAIVLAANADLDVLMFSNNIYEDEKVSGEELHQIIVKNVKNGQISMETIAKSYQRIISLKAEMGMLEQDYRESLQNRLNELY